MDTDVEVLKPIDVFLSNHAFSGFEDVDCVPTGIMACEKGYTLFKELLDDYKNRHFILPDKSYDMTNKCGDNNETVCKTWFGVKQHITKY